MKEKNPVTAMLNEWMNKGPADLRAAKDQEVTKESKKSKDSEK
jgi:hypothetical protein